MPEQPPKAVAPGARTALVLALLALAALALPARRGLDWSALADPVGVRWARVLVGALLLLALIAAGRSVLRRLRRSTRAARPGSAARSEPDGEPVGWGLRLLAVLLVLAVLALTWWVVQQVVVAEPGAGPAGPPDPLDPAGTGASAGAAGWPLLTAVAVALVLGAVLTRLAARRTAAPAGRPRPGGVEDEVATLAAAVEAARVRLDRPHDDARVTIVAAWSAMAASIAADLARRGRSARASDTPTELLVRAVAAGLVGADGAAAAGALTELFREARFSGHPMGRAERDAATAHLGVVRAELGAAAAR